MLRLVIPLAGAIFAALVTGFLAANGAPRAHVNIAGSVCVSLCFLAWLAAEDSRD